MKNNQLFNEKNKREFLDDKFAHDNKAYNTLLSMFEQLSQDEYENNTDLCDMHPQQYALLLAKYARYNKFSSYYYRYQLLLIYRDYCIERNWINNIKFYGNLNRFGDIPMTGESLYDIFNERRKSYRKYFYTPKELYDFLFYDIYDIKYLKFTPTGTLNSHGFTNAVIETIFPDNTISSDELVVLYLCLLYYGIPKNQCCNIKNKDIIIEENRGKIVIHLNHQIYMVDIFLQSLIERIMSAKYISRKRNETQTLILKDNEYLLCYDEDDTFEARIKRNKKLSDKYYKDAERKQEDVISVKEIIDQGVVYRMCALSFDKHLHPKTMQDHIDLYKVVGGTGIMNSTSARAVELRRIYTEHFNELYLSE